MVRKRTREAVGVVAVGLVAVAAAVGLGGCAGGSSVAQVTSTDAAGLCVRDLDSGRVDCWRYTPEFPSETRYRAGECLELTYGYRYSGPPHTRRVACPAGTDTTVTAVSGGS